MDAPLPHQTPQHQAAEKGFDLPKRWLLLILAVIFVIAGILVAVSPRTDVRNNLYTLYLRLSGAHVDYVYMPQVHVTGLHHALETYTAVYGRYPFEGVLIQDQVNSRALISVLTAATNDPVTLRENPEGMKFMELGTNSVVNGNIVDDWGNPYHIAFDSNHVGTIKICNATIKATVAVWSDGPNRINENGTGDDIRSWK
jgi:hypothetical protein